MKRGELASARRYARALLEVAFTRPEGDPAALRRELERAAALLEEQEALLDALVHPGVPLEAKQRVVAQVWTASPRLLRRLLDLLVEKRRLELLPAIARAYTDLWNAARGVLRAEALSATPLTEEQRQAVERALGRLTGRDVELAAEVHPALLGGLMVRLDGRVYDGTVRGRLRALREQLGRPSAG